MALVMGTMTVPVLTRKIFVAAMTAASLVFISYNFSIAAESTQIPVPKQMIYAGKPITAMQLRGRIVPNTYLNSVSVFVRHEDIVGKVAKFNLAPSKPIRTNQLSEPDVVSVNKPAILRFQAGSLSISAEVIPLNSAKVGEAVRVRNMQNNSIIYGVAKQDGTISARLSK